MSAPKDANKPTKTEDKLAEAMAEMDRVLAPQLQSLRASSLACVQAAASLSDKAKRSNSLQVVKNGVGKADSTLPFAKIA